MCVGECLFLAALGAEGVHEVYVCVEGGLMVLTLQLPCVYFQEFWSMLSPSSPHA